MNEGLYDRAFTQKHTNAPMLVIEGAEVPLNEAIVKEGGNPQAMLVWDKATQSLAEIHARGVDEDIEFRGMIETADGQSVPVKTVWLGLKERADRWTPEEAAKMSWVDAETIRASARTYATAPAATINVFQGLEEQTNCKDILQLVNCIIAICGNLEKRGGNLSMPFWNQMGPLTGAEPATQKELRIVDERAAGTVYGISNPTCLFKAMRTGPYPVKRLHHGAGQPAVVGREHRAREGIAHARPARVHGLLLCRPHAELADLVLPSTHWTERDYLADRCAASGCSASRRSSRCTKRKERLIMVLRAH